MIEPTLKRIYAQARSMGFSASELKSFQKKLKTAFDQGIADPEQAILSLERLFLENEDLKWILEKERLSMTLKLFGYCEHLSQMALKQPAKLLSALEKAEQGMRSREKIQQELIAEIEDSESFEEMAKKLRQFRNEEYLRLALLNLSVEDRLEEEFLELSALAESAMELGLKALSRIKQVKNFYRPGFAVLGMGKLGSEELNFSSDIDLIYICQSFRSGESDRAFLELYSQLAQAFTELVSKITEDSFVFRIDLRLRPGGESGPIVNPYDSALDYYLNFGRTWERAAMLRARAVAGDLELGKKFLKELEPFVFRRFHDFASLEDLKEIKSRIEREASQESAQKNFAGYNIKLGQGGIREIEFFINSLQLIYGGKYPELRTTRTMDALNALNRLNLVRDEDAEALKRAWRFLRRVEHRIQLKDLRQEHRIPRTRRGQEILARSFSQASLDDFLSRLGQFLSQVQSIFSGLFGEEQTEEKKLSRFLDLKKGSEELALEFTKLGFTEPELASENWARILRPLSQEKAGARLRAEFLPILLEEISQTPEPDLTLSQMERFLSRTGARAGFLSLLKDHQQVRHLLLNLFSQSEFLGNLLINHPELLDELVREEALKERTEDELEKELVQELKAGTDYEDKLSRLRKFQKLELLRVGLKDLSGQLEIQELEQRLSVLAEMLLRQAYYVSLEELTKKYGVPEENSGLVVLGLGRLGGREMSWASDLDLIFIYQSQGETVGKSGLDIREFFIKFSQKIIATLQAQTAEGFLYKIDTRLRPSGTQGPLVVSANAFYEYHETRAQVWEKQSLLKARVMVDGAGIGDEVSERIARSIYEGNTPETLSEEMRKLLRRVRAELARENENLYDIKFGYGGEMELDYIIQYFQLLNGASFTELGSGNSWKALERLRDLKLIEDAEYRDLYESLLLYRKISSRLRIYQDRPENMVKLDADFMEKLTRKVNLPGIDSGEKLKEVIDSARKKVHTIFMKYIGE